MNRRGFTACFLGLWQWKGRRKEEVDLSELPGVIIFNTFSYVWTRNSAT